MPFGNEKGHVSNYQRSTHSTTLEIYDSIKNRPYHIPNDNFYQHRRHLVLSDIFSSKLSRPVNPVLRIIKSRAKFHSSKRGLLRLKFAPKLTLSLSPFVRLVWLLALFGTLLPGLDCKPSRSPVCDGRSSCDTKVMPADALPHKVAPKYPLTHKRNLTELCTNVKGWWLCDMTYDDSYGDRTKSFQKSKRDRKRKRIYNGRSKVPSEPQRLRPAPAERNLQHKFVVIKDSVAKATNLIANDTLVDLYIGNKSSSNSKTSPTDTNYVIRARVEEENISYHRFKAELTLLEVQPRHVANSVKNSLTGDMDRNVPINSVSDTRSKEWGVIAHRDHGPKPTPDSKSRDPFEDLVLGTTLIITAKIYPITADRDSHYTSQQSRSYAPDARIVTEPTIYDDPIIGRLKRWAKHDPELVEKFKGMERWRTSSYGHDPNRVADQNYTYTRLQRYESSLPAPSHPTSYMAAPLRFHKIDDKWNRVGMKTYPRSTGSGTASQIYRRSPVLPLKIIPLKILKGPAGISKQIVGKPIFAVWKVDSGHFFQNEASGTSNLPYYVDLGTFRRSALTGITESTTYDPAQNTDTNSVFRGYGKRLDSLDPKNPQIGADTLDNTLKSYHNHPSDPDHQNTFVLFLEPYRTDRGIYSHSSSPRAKEGPSINSNSRPLRTPLRLFYMHSLPFVSSPKIRRQIRKIHIRSSDICKNPNSRNLIRISNYHPTPMRIFHDKALVLSCQINKGKGSSKIKWYKDGHRIHLQHDVKNHQIVMINQTRKLSTLRINHVRLKDSGIYQCRTKTFCRYNIVSPNTTVEIYRKAHHPKTYVSLSGQISNDHDRIIDTHIRKSYSPSCEANICGNGGTCLTIKSGTSFCECSDGFTGDHCQYKV